MRRIAVPLLLLAGGLALTPGARATVQQCPDLDHHGYAARGISEQGIGCHIAREYVVQFIDHGTADHLTCSRSFLPHNVTLWSCHGVRHGEKQKLEFGLRPL